MLISRKDNFEFIMTPEERVRAILELSRFTGVDVSSQFIRNTKDHFPAAGIPRIHNLAEGIYKPVGDKYAFCIWSRSAAGQDKEIYPDNLKQQKDGTWTMNYAAKAGSLQSAVNLSLFSCMQDRALVLVIVTSKPSSPSSKAQYRLLGPAIIEDFNSSTRRFYLRGCSPLIADQLTDKYGELEALKLQMRNQLITPFQVQERASYQAQQIIRNKAFRKIILEEYRCLCVVCQSKFLLRQKESEPLIEADAAHIISVNKKGPDDPRNGLSLCKRHHWAFDNGLFTITDARQVKVSPSVHRAEQRRFDLEEYDGEAIVPPANECCRPHEDALHWHQAKVFRSN